MLKYVEDSLVTSVFFGPQGFKLFKAEDDQKEAQVKFSCENGWNKDWFVVGIDTELGDPYLIKQNNEDARVYTAIFDGVSWSLVPVSHTVQSFIKCLTLLQHLSSQKSELYVPDQTTISDSAILHDLEEQLITTSQCDEFWQQFFICYKDWLVEE